MPATREQRLRAWLDETLASAAQTSAPYTLERASDDASFRRYLRLRLRDGSSRIVMDAPPETEQANTPLWLDIGARLKAAGLNTPQVHALDLAQGFLLIDDLGATAYLDVLDENRVDALYADALRALATMQRDVSSAGLACFDADWMRMELALMPHWFLHRHLGHAVGAHETLVLEQVFQSLLACLLAQPQVFMHRDFHSRNLMLTPRDNPGIIDFQGAMRGPVAYDVASLLRDCYIVWPPARVDAWAQAYRQAAVDAGQFAASPAEFQRWFDFAGLQRHIKVLGIFCRLYYRDAKPAYLADLPRVLQYVLDVAGRYPEFDAFSALLRGAVAGRDITLPAPTPA